MANEPDIVQRLSVDFNVVNTLDVDLQSSPQTFDADFGTVYISGGGGGDCKVLYASTATWNSQPQLVSLRGYIYVYSDYKQNEQGKNVPAIKVGDGLAYLIDMPFVEDLMYDHIENTVVHVTQAEKDFWNNKVRCYLDGSDNLVFTTD